RRLGLEIFNNRVIIIGAGTFGWTGDINILLAVQREGHGRIAVMGRTIVARSPGLRPVSILIFDRDEIRLIGRVAQAENIQYAVQKSVHDPQEAAEQSAQESSASGRGRGRAGDAGTAGDIDIACLVED